MSSLTSLFKGSSKQGRRASSTEKSDELLLETPIRKKKGGWAEETSKPHKEKLEKEKSIESDEDIPVIPDIDDLQDDLNLPDIKIPNTTVVKSTYKELDSQFDQLQIGQASFGNLSDTDLSALTSRLYPEKELKKSDEIWTMESLLQDIKSYNNYKV